MRRRVSDFTAGLIAIGVTVVATYLAFAGGLPWHNDYTLYAHVRSANEMHSRTPVRIAGVEVGRVAGFQRAPGGTAIVKLELKKNALPIHRDATIKIRPRIFLEGNFFVDLKPGSPSSPELGSGGTIPLSQTAVPVQLDQVLSTLDEDTRGNLLKLVHGLSTAVDDGGSQTFDRTLKYWEPAFLNGAVTAEAFRGINSHDLSAFIRDGGVTAAAVGEDSAALANLVTGLNRTARALAQRRAKVEDAVTQLAGLVDEAVPTFHAINAAMPQTRGLVRDLRPALRVAPPTLRSANSVVDQANALISPRELPRLLDQLDPAVRTLARVEPRLAELLRLLNPVTECARTNALPTLKKSVDDPPLTTGMPVYRELLSGIVGLASASSNFTGDGPAVRYHAGFGDKTVSIGKVPSTGEVLRGASSQPLIGSRPAYTGERPPLRPDVPCGQNKPPDLTAATTKAQP